MTADRFILRRLAFTGPGKEIRDLEFSPGFTVVWGGSQAGKSFAIKALDHMFGSGSDLPALKQALGYERCWLELDLPNSGRVTLARSMAKGGYDLFEGTIDNSFGKTSTRTLADNNKSKKETLSSFLLGELGIGDVQIAKKLSGDKDPFTIRHFASYMFTEETPMIAEESPITIDRRSNDTFNKNVLKYILTGVDDRSIVQVPDARQQRQTNAGRIEIVEEMLTAGLAELSAMYPGVDVDSLKLDEQNERLNGRLTEFRESLAARHVILDSLTRERRAMMFERDDHVDAEKETELTIERFKLLATSYASDIKRLIALEEGAAVLMIGSKRICYVCGAAPEHQHEEHGFEAVETSQKAVTAELRKVRAESAGLVRATESLEADLMGVKKRIAALDQQIEIKNGEIEEARLAEVKTREEYDGIDRARQKLNAALSVERRIQSLRARKAELAKFKAKSTPRGNIVVGAGTVVGDQLAKAVQKIFEAWQYPGEPRISFHEKTHDILLNGSQRNANGKGVRALLTAAFKIGVMDVCRENGVPHPGIITLDSPLLSYRDPLKSKHTEELSEEEKTVVAAGLKSHFYDYLIKRSGEAQFIVIENQDPPYALPDSVREYVFTGEHASEGRKGLF